MGFYSDVESDLGGVVDRLNRLSNQGKGVNPSKTSLSSLGETIAQTVPQNADTQYQQTDKLSASDKWITANAVAKLNTPDITIDQLALADTRGYSLKSTISGEIDRQMSMGGLIKKGAILGEGTATSEELKSVGSLVPNSTNQMNLVGSSTVEQGISNFISGLGLEKLPTGKADDFTDSKAAAQDLELSKATNIKRIMDSPLGKLLKDNTALFNSLTGDPAVDGPALGTLMALHEQRVRAGLLVSKGFNPNSKENFINTQLRYDDPTRQGTIGKAVGDFLTKNSQDIRILSDGVFLMAGTGAFKDVAQMAGSATEAVAATVSSKVATGKLREAFIDKAIKHIGDLAVAENNLVTKVGAESFAKNAFVLAGMNAGEKVGDKYFDSPLMGALIGASLITPGAHSVIGIVDIAKQIASGKQDIPLTMLAQGISESSLSSKLILKRLTGAIEYGSIGDQDMLKVIKNAMELADKINPNMENAAFLAKDQMVSPAYLAAKKLTRLGVNLQDQGVMQMLENNFKSALTDKFGSSEIYLSKNFKESIQMEDLHKAIGLFNEYKFSVSHNAFDPMSMEWADGERMFKDWAEDVSLDEKTRKMIARQRTGDIIDPMTDLGRQVKDLQMYNEAIGSNIIFNTLRKDKRYIEYFNEDGIPKNTEELLKKAYSDSPTLEKVHKRLTNVVLKDTDQGLLYNINGMLTDTWETAKGVRKAWVMPKTYVFQDNPKLATDLVYDMENLQRYGLGLKKDLDKALTNIYEPLSKNHREIFQDALYQANMQQEKIELDGTLLKIGNDVKPLPVEVAEALRAHNLLTDYMYHLSNGVQVRSLRNQGFLIDSATGDLIRVKPRPVNMKVTEEATAQAEKNITKDMSPDVTGVEMTKMGQENQVGLIERHSRTNGKYTTEQVPMDTINNQFRKIEYSDQIIPKVDFYSPLMYKDPIRIYGVINNGDKGNELRLLATATTRKNADNAKTAILANIEGDKAKFKNLIPESIVIAHSNGSTKYLGASSGAFDFMGTVGVKDIQTMRSSFARSIAHLPVEEQTKILQQVDEAMMTLAKPSYNTKAYMQDRAVVKPLNQQLTGTAEVLPSYKAMQRMIASVSNDIMTIEKKNTLKEKFLAAYGNLLDDGSKVTLLSEGGTKKVYQDWASPIRKGLEQENPVLFDEVKAVQRQLKTIFSFMSPEEEVMLNKLNRFSDYISTKGTLGNIASEFANQHMIQDAARLPQHLRGLTANFVLGMWNVSAGIMQALGSLNTIGSLNPQYTSAGLRDFTSWYTANGLRKLVKMGTNDAIDTGMPSWINDLHQVVKRTKMIEDVDIYNMLAISNENFGVRGKLDMVRSMSSIFTTEGERMNRLVSLFSHRRQLIDEVQKGIAKDLEGNIIQPFEIDKSQGFLDTLSKRAGETAIIMNKYRSPEFNKGLSGLALQFQSYPAYLTDFFLRNLSATQRVGVTAVQMGLFGHHGIPLSDDVATLFDSQETMNKFYTDSAMAYYRSDMNKGEDGKPKVSVDSLNKMLKGVTALTADIDMSKRAGFGMTYTANSSLFEKGLLQSMPFFGIAKNAFTAMSNIKLAYDMGIGNMNVFWQEAQGVVPAAKKIHDATQVWQTGSLTTQDGKLRTSGLSKYDAVLLGMGLNPFSVANTTEQTQVIQDVQKHAKEFAKKYATELDRAIYADSIDGKTPTETGLAHAQKGWAQMEYLIMKEYKDNSLAPIVSKEFCDMMQQLQERRQMTRETSAVLTAAKLGLRNQMTALIGSSTTRTKKAFIGGNK